MSRRNDLKLLYVLLVSMMLLGFDRTLAEINKEETKGKKQGAGNKVSSRSGIEYGQEAPDFELPRLTIEKGKDGKAVGRVSEEKVKLSSFRGKKPVFLVFSSYT